MKLISYKNLYKRIFDMIFSFISLIILSPLLLIIVALIFIFDGKSVIFKQSRIGREGIEFKFYKFRTMPVGTLNISSDSIGKVNLTWIGCVLRRTNLDELPQLYNILKGEMSFVGPRPSIATQVALTVLRKKNGALQVRPGLTGLAQVSSFDGMQVNEKAYFDGIYANNISFLNDIKIIGRTFTYLLAKPPVY